jgi:Putative Ig domain
VLDGVTDSATGLFTFTVTATDKTGRKVTKDLALVVAAPMIFATPLGLPLATVGSNYSTTIDAVGGVAPHSFTLADGALPQGLTMSMAGRLTGVPSLAGISLFTVRMLDSRGSTGTQTFRFVVERPAQSVVKKPPVLKKPAKKKKKRR